MKGAIFGDVVGSIYEFENCLSTDIEWDHPRMHITDDSVLSIATMEALMNLNLDFVGAYKTFFRLYPDANKAWGGRFLQWALSDSYQPYHSYGNGSAMRVSPVAYVAQSESEVLHLAQKSAEVTHNHPEGIKGAQAIALAVYYARLKLSKLDIQKKLEARFHYVLDLDEEFHKANVTFDETCQGSVPVALYAFLKATDFKSTIALAISLGGDSDTIAAIAGSIAEAYYGMSAANSAFVDKHLDERLKEIVDRFYVTFVNH